MSSVILPFTRLVEVINYKSGEWIGSLLQAGSIPALTTKLNIMSRTIKKAKKVVAKSCRNNGSCSYCRGNRLHKHNKKIESILDASKEMRNNVFKDLLIYGKATYSLNTNKE